jgi:FMN phosphatase YigB (HAD superfamily)
LNSEVIRDFDHKALLFDILQKATAIETISVESLTGLIMRIDIPESLTPFRSDIFSEQNTLLNSENYMLSDTGMKITQLVLKCCIVQKSPQPELVNYGSTYRKRPVNLSEMVNEFKAQLYAYRKTLHLGGSPVCPDAVAFIELSSKEFQAVFFDNPQMPPIYENNEAFQYIGHQLENYPDVRTVSITLMESIGPEYEALYVFNTNMKLLPELEKQEKLSVFHDLSLRVLAIYVVLFYCAGIILLDGHLGNWMYLKEEEWSSRLPIEQTLMNPFLIRAIDFGRFFHRKKHVVQINETTKQYFQRFSQTRVHRLRQFAQILGVHPDFIRSSQEAGDAVENIFEQLNRSIAQDPRGNILWEGNTIVHADLQIDESMMVIHKILFLGMILDPFYNTVRLNREEHRFQMRIIFDTVYAADCHTPIDMMKENLNIDLHAYMSDLVDEDQDEMRVNLKKIKKYIGEYLNWKDDFITHIYFDWLGTLAEPKTQTDQLYILYDDTISILDYLKKKGYTLGIITKTSIDRTILQSIGLIDFFEGTIAIGDDACDKWCPEIFISTLRKDGVNPRNTVMIGNDYTNDILGCNSLDMGTVFIDRANTSVEFNEADLKINNLEELMNYF